LISRTFHIEGIEMLKRYFHDLTKDIQFFLGMLVGLLFVPVIIIAKLIRWPFAKGVNLTAQEVAAYIRNELHDLHDDRYRWEDFEQISVRDPYLESIRQQATKIAWPLTDAGREKLEELLRRLES
jgi:hypothetical protein